MSRHGGRSSLGTLFRSGHLSPNVEQLVNHQSNFGPVLGVAVWAWNMPTEFVEISWNPCCAMFYLRFEA